MVDYDALRKSIINGLSDFTKKTVIRADHTGPQPPYPFVEVKNTLIDDENGQIAQYMKGSKRVFEQDIELTYSINSYDKTNAGALSLIQQAKLFFQASGLVAYQDINVAIIETTPITDRTSFLVTEYQYRYGFDIRIRVRSRTELTVDTIDRVNLNMK